MSTSNNQINFLGIIYWLVSSIKKHFRVLLIVNIILAVAVASAKIYIKPSYEGRMIVKSNIIEFHFIEQILAPLQQHIKDKRKESIAKSLKISPQLANTMGGFETQSIIDEEYVAKRRYTNADMLSEYEKDQVFELTVTAADKDSLPKLKNAILNYLRQQQYIRDRQQFFTERQKEIRDLYEKDIQSMQKIKESFGESGIDPNIKDNDLIIQGLGDFFFGSMKIYESYVDSWYLLEFNDSFEELSAFEIYDKHVAPRWTPFILIYILIAIIFSFVYITIAEMKVALRKYEEESED